MNIEFSTCTNSWNFNFADKEVRLCNVSYSVLLVFTVWF